MVSEIDRIAREITPNSQGDRVVEEIKQSCQEFLKLNEKLVESGKELEGRDRERMDKISKVLREFYSQSVAIAESLRLNEQQFLAGRIGDDAHERRLRQLTQEITALNFNFSTCSPEINDFERRIELIIQPSQPISPKPEAEQKLLPKEEKSREIFSEKTKQQIVNPETIVNIVSLQVEKQKTMKNQFFEGAISPRTDDTAAMPPDIAKPENVAQSSSLIRRYPNLFKISSLTFPYVVHVGAWVEGSNEFRRGEVKCFTVSDKYVLPEDFTVSTNCNGETLENVEDKCKLWGYTRQLRQRGVPNELSFTFAKITYPDYLLSGEHLDDPLPGKPNQTFRDKYATQAELRDVSKSKLTNISGVGIFVITRDNKIIISKHSPHVRVYSGILSYSASGTMDWRPKIHIFDEIARECHEEIGHNIDLDDTFLFGFGIDVKKWVYQFSFFEKTCMSSTDICLKAEQADDFKAEMDELIAVPFDANKIEDLYGIVDLMKTRQWEPAAAVALLTLCTKSYGLEHVEKAINPSSLKTRRRDEMKAEWNKRAQRAEPFTVMSTRYPFNRCAEESRKYVKAVTDFIGEDIDDKDVLEVGCGTGRLTTWLVSRANQLTCLDICHEMIERNKIRIANKAKKVSYFEIFAQDYRRPQKHDVVISSLVLIHNVDDDAFNQVVAAMCDSADTIFIFEHVNDTYSNDHTRIRTENELKSAFHGYKVKKQMPYTLFNDTLLFLKLERRHI